MFPNTLRGHSTAAESNARESRRILGAVYTQSDTAGKEEFRNPGFFVLSVSSALFGLHLANLVDPEAPPD